MRAAPRGLFHPYVQILVGALLVTASEICLKKGAVAGAMLGGQADWLNLAALHSAWVWAAMALYAASFGTWLHVLRYVPLSVAFNLSNIVHVFVPLASWLALGEDITPRRWLGIALVLAGIWVIAEPLVRLETRLEKRL